jgi:hypothetical protein
MSDLMTFVDLPLEPSLEWLLLPSAERLFLGELIPVILGGLATVG